MGKILNIKTNQVLKNVYTSPTLIQISVGPIIIFLNNL